MKIIRYEHCRLWLYSKQKKYMECFRELKPSFKKEYANSHVLFFKEIYLESLRVGMKSRRQKWFFKFRIYLGFLRFILNALSRCESIGNFLPAVASLAFLLRFFIGSQPALCIIICSTST